ncbi:MAG TPA: Mor transcription activator family protein [bacterium]|nr:Mor transcription activator family protein [bacterium]
MDMQDKGIAITIEDMPNDDLLFVAKNCGVEVAAALMLRLQGLSISIPRNALRKVIARYICENYNGNNIKQLAVDCRVSIRQVYAILQKNRRLSRSRRPLPGR